MKNLFKPLLIGLFLFCLFASVNAASHVFAITAPGAAGATTSNTYTITWTPAYGGTYGADTSFNMDKNTISCYLDSGNTVYNKTFTIKTGYHSDANAYTFDTISFLNAAARRLSPTYYVWCMNDSNSDQNAYSPGKLTITSFKGADLANLGIDFPGGILAGIANNANVIGVMVAILIIIVFAIDLVTGAFGIIDKLKSVAGSRR